MTELQTTNEFKPCLICQGQAGCFGVETLLRKHQVTYWRCEVCKFIFLSPVHWLEEAYSEAIARTDVGMIMRNAECRDLTLQVIKKLKLSGGIFADYGGGYGIFTRLMRDVGKNFYWMDRYCENLFARSFEVSSIPEQRFDLVTCFEVFEHLENPLATFEELLKISGTVLFSTELPPSSDMTFEDFCRWDYRSLETGQHISFYTIESLKKLAEKFGCYYQTDGCRYHLISREKPKKHVFRRNLLDWFCFLMSKLTLRLQAGSLKNNSLISQDFKKMVDLAHRDKKQ